MINKDTLEDILNNNNFEQWLTNYAGDYLRSEHEGILRRAFDMHRLILADMSTQERIFLRKSLGVIPGSMPITCIEKLAVMKVNRHFSDVFDARLEPGVATIYVLYETVAGMQSAMQDLNQIAKPQDIDELSHLFFVDKKLSVTYELIPANGEDHSLDQDYGKFALTTFFESDTCLYVVYA